MNEDMKKIKVLRNYYARTFVTGHSDENFLIWIEETLKDLKVMELDKKVDRQIEMLDRLNSKAAQ